MDALPAILCRLEDQAALLLAEGQLAGDMTGCQRVVARNHRNLWRETLALTEVGRSVNKMLVIQCLKPKIALHDERLVVTLALQPATLAAAVWR